MRLLAPITRPLPLRLRAAAAALAGAALGVAILGTSFAAAATSPDALRTCWTGAGPAWSHGGETGSRWTFVASENVLCREHRRFVDLLAPRIVSSGSVDVQRFGTADGWSCLTGRSLGLGFCSSRAGGVSRIAFVVVDSAQGRALVSALRVGGAGAVLGPVIGSSSGSGGALDLDDEEAKLPTPCTARPGSTWSRTAREGNMWLSYAGGGITCIAAQGWVIDVSGRMPAGTTPFQFDGGDGWRCIAGPNAARLGARVGACARATNWRTSLEPRHAVIAGGMTTAERSRLVSYGYDGAIWEIAGAAAPSFSLPQTCGHKGAVWRIGGSTGNRWLVGTSGGYPCPVASAAAVKLLAATQAATGDRTLRKGVRDAWRCQFTAATRTTACTWNGVSRVPSDRRALKLVFTPDRPGASAIANAALAP